MSEQVVIDGNMDGWGTADPVVTARSHQSDFSDAMLAQRAATEVLNGRFCWAEGLSWLQWDGKRWNQCSEVEATECVRLWAVGHFERAAGLVRTGKVDDGLVKRWLTALAKSKLSAVVSLARGIDGIKASAKDFDHHPDLLNVANGVVDLRTGQLYPHNPALKLTKITSVVYNPGAVHSDWTAALEAIPADVRDWYQVRLGQSITGHMTPDDVMLMQVGGGENGKSSITGAVMKTLGDYAVMVSDKVILADPRAHTTERMELRGARFALIEELPDGHRLTVNLLKKVLGTPVMTARHVNKNETRWEASHSLFLSTNYIPIVDETDHGTWRRLLLMRFPFTFRKPGEPCTHALDRRGDPGLRGRLASGALGPQHEAVLAWLVAGAVVWYASQGNMPAPPARVVRDTADWRSESDLVLGYIGECLEFSPGSHVMSSELLTGFNSWLAERGHTFWSDKLFSARFGDHYEVTQHRVVKKYVRANNALSRRPGIFNLAGIGSSSTPAGYKAWVGIRFADRAPAAAPTWDVSGVSAVCINS